VCRERRDQDLAFGFRRNASEPEQDYPRMQEALAKDQLAEILIRSQEQRPLRVRQAQHRFVVDSWIHLAHVGARMAGIALRRDNRRVHVLVGNKIHNR